MHIVYTRRALDHLATHAAAIARDNPGAAREQVARIRRSINQLATFPDMGRPGRIEGTRELAAPRTQFVIVYRTEPQRVVILRVLHGRQKYP
ncbi:type II toxin-antitoxin system RelE/ParE family toxin [Chelatococcus asaccharovorans]|uniref:type II toxin-antitoxin system RelE/ParE family toxin n=1 Tax=Chelatococcus asaccharovorans TaxID=28210 RepID=UPI0022653859|nr:type II toxin-antitoxin system RelE/ParE family toxin [Chelatococcus asaccharovorans]